MDQKGTDPMSDRPQPGAATISASTGQGESPSEGAGRQTIVRTLVGKAAQAAIENGCDIQDFMTAAYQAYLHASPELRERLERAQLLMALDDLRRRGKLGEA